MLIVLAAAYNLALPYWDTLKRQLAEKRISSLTINHAPNLVTHPIGITVLIFLGIFSLPADPVFYLAWSGMIVIASFSLVLNIWGLLKTQFFGAQILGRLGFLTSTLVAIVLLDERVSSVQVIALMVAFAAVLLFAWPKRMKGTSFTWDTGILFILLSLIIGAFSTVLYKLAALHAPSYQTFLTGRFVADLIGWTLIWFIGIATVSRLNPLLELGRCIKAPEGRLMILGVAASSLLSSWLIYELPVVTFAMLGTLTIPSAYLWSRFKYNEAITLRMWAGTVLSLAAIVLFLYPFQ